MKVDIEVTYNYLVNKMTVVDKDHNSNNIESLSKSKKRGINVSFYTTTGDGDSVRGVGGFIDLACFCVLYSDTIYLLRVEASKESVRSLNNGI